MGIVYLGWDPRLEREVAIKVLPPELAQDAQIRERFEVEARSAGRLQHPNILPVYSVGQADGQPYLVMQRVRGQELAAALRDHGRLGLAAAGSILRGIASAVDYAHANNVIHRDLKPENVMLDDRGQVLLMDFGIARAMDGARRGLTRTGMIIGTPEYMSPEQAAGKPVDYRSDLYSFGILAYRMLTGAVPFAGDSLIGVATQHVHGTPPDPRSLAPDLSTGVATALLLMLAKEPAERYASATAFVEALLAGSETRRAPQPWPGPAWPAPEAAPPARSMAGPAALVAAALLLGCALVAAALLLNHQPEPALNTPPPPVVNNPGPVTPPPSKTEDSPPTPKRLGPADGHFEPGTTVVYRDREHQALNIRSGPSRDESIVAKASWGATLAVLGQQDLWVHVQYQGQEGWCAWHRPGDESYRYLFDPSEAP
jgi:serine/threonine-protein kinase